MIYKLSNVAVHDLDQIARIKESFPQRICLIFATGFYAYLIQKGRICSFHLYQSSGKPFLMRTYNI